MSKIYQLLNQIQHYEWGSPSYIPEFLGIENKDAAPYAELWMGTHPSSPSKAFTGSLDNIHDNYTDLSEINGGPLPFLFKLLAAGKPLSIQAHPNLTQAKEGFARENKMGIPLNSPKRNYKDSNHKPEILCAVTPFTLMAGFRKPQEIRENINLLIQASSMQNDADALNEILGPLLETLNENIDNNENIENIGSIKKTGESNLLSGFLKTLFEIPKDKCEKLCKVLSSISENKNEKTGSQEKQEACKLDNYINDFNKLIIFAKQFAQMYPSDAAVMSPLYLNVLSLESSQAVYVPAGILHSYISGFGIELMAGSDNVLRGGLTAKNIDKNELMNILDFIPFKPEIINPPVPSQTIFSIDAPGDIAADIISGQEKFCYPAPCDDFTLNLLCSSGGEIQFPFKEPAICIVTSGELTCAGGSFKKGESFYISKENADDIISFNGTFSLFAAS